MRIRILQVPYDSGQHAARMGRGPVHLTEHGLLDRLRARGHEVDVEVIETAETFPSEIKVTFDLHRRNARRHLTFGVGPHFCAGAEMARVEGKVAFEVLLGRLDNIRLADHEDLEHQPSFSARGYKHVHIEFDPIR